MNALIHIVDHVNERFEADRSGWRDMISHAYHLLNCHDLGGFAALCNQSFDAVEGEYYLYKNWQFLFLGPPTYIRIRNGVKGHEEDKESNYVGSATMEAGVTALNPLVDANTSLRITSG
jgi:hypothetical protein